MAKLDAKFYGTLRKAKDGSVVPDDEYVVFLAKDNALPVALAKYRDECFRLGCESEQVQAVDALIERVARWRKENTERCKNPDIAGETTVPE